MSGTEDYSKMSVKQLEQKKDDFKMKIETEIQSLFANNKITEEEKDKYLKKPGKIKDKKLTDEKDKDSQILILTYNEEIKKIDEAIEKAKKDKKSKKDSKKSKKIVDKKKADNISPGTKRKYIGIAIGAAAIVVAGALALDAWLDNQNDKNNSNNLDDDSYGIEQTIEPVSTPDPTVTYDPSNNEIVAPYDYGSDDNGNDDEYEYLYTTDGVVRIKKSDKEKLGQVPTYVPSSTDSTPTPSTTDNSKSDYSDNGYDNAENSDAGYGESSYAEMYEYYNYQIDLNEDIINGRRVNYYENVICNVDYNGRDYDIGERVDKVRKAAMNNQYDNAYNQKTIDDILVILKCGEYKNQTERLQLATAGILATGIGSKFTNNTYPNETRYFISESQAALEMLRAYSPGRTMGY